MRKLDPDSKKQDAEIAYDLLRSVESVRDLNGYVQSMAGKYDPSGITRLHSFFFGYAMSMYMHLPADERISAFKKFIMKNVSFKNPHYADYHTKESEFLSLVSFVEIVDDMEKTVLRNKRDT